MNITSGLLALGAAVCFICAAQAQNLELPDPLKMTDGKRVESVEQWKNTRRPEVLELFRKHIYGRAPVGRPNSLKFDVQETTPDALDGKATRKLVKITYAGPGGTGAIQLTIFTPNNVKGAAPCFLLICNRGAENVDPTREVKSPFWPVEEIIGRGYATAAFLNTNIAPDSKDAWTKGAHQIFDAAQRAPDAWGTIAAWAWGASRAMDYLVTDKAIDARRVALVGHSRGGKTALWAAAEDERFAMAVSNESGSTGAALARGKVGEHIKDINRNFPHWFCDNYKKYDDREAELPVDQHMLLALSAPRLLYVASATEDIWADPKSEFAAAVQAGPVYKLHGLTGLSNTNFPAPEQPVQGGSIGYHLRTGKHDLTKYDWGRYMDFTDKHEWKTSAAP